MFICLPGITKQSWLHNEDLKELWTVSRSLNFSRVSECRPRETNRTLLNSPVISHNPQSLLTRANHTHCFWLLVDGRLEILVIKKPLNVSFWAVCEINLLSPHLLANFLFILFWNEMVLSVGLPNCAFCIASEFLTAFFSKIRESVIEMLSHLAKKLPPWSGLDLQTLTVHGTMGWSSPHPGAPRIIGRNHTTNGQVQIASVVARRWQIAVVLAASADWTRITQQLLNWVKKCLLEGESAVVVPVATFCARKVFLPAFFQKHFYPKAGGRSSPNQSAEHFISCAGRPEHESGISHSSWNLNVDPSGILLSSHFNPNVNCSLVTPFRSQ